MKRLIILVFICMTSLSGIHAQGLPFIRNISSKEYHAHNQNFDIITGEDGTIFVANFEGLLYYDNADWRVIHTPNVTRITSVFRDSKNVVWAGGYNFIGYVTIGNRGELKLYSLRASRFHGEVQWIWERDGQISFLTSESKIFHVNGEEIVFDPKGKVPTSGFATISTVSHINQIQQMDEGLQAIATNGEGIIITDQSGKPLYNINEGNGLCSNNVTHITYNRMGQLWGATDNGVFVISLPSIYSRFTLTEGLRSEVTSLEKLGNDIYAGTLSGLYRRSGTSFVSVSAINHTCWQIVKDGQGQSLLVATMDGVYRIFPNGSVRQLTTSTTLSLMVDGNNFYSGEMDGLYYNTPDGQHKKLNNTEKVITILKDRSGRIWLKTIYGKVLKRNRDGMFVPFTSNKDAQEVATLIYDKGNVKPILASATKPFPYPMYNYTDKNNTFWLTNNKGKELYAIKNGVRDEQLSLILKPFRNYATRAILFDNKHLWIGGEKGIGIVDFNKKPIQLKEKPKVVIRSIYLRSDSLLWGGYGKQPEVLPKLASNERELSFNFSLNFTYVVEKPLFRYRINGAKWSPWDEETSAMLYNQPYGKNTFEVQGQDSWGRLSEITKITFIYEYPLYLRWYSIVCYIILLVLIVYVVFQYRLRQLEKDKIRLEHIVKDRTAEVVRLEKMATVGKLTQGLIDRILNPLNYINNFAKLSQGLVKDITANIEDEKENMNPDNYEDTMDVLNMLDGNLQKVSEHGANTTRTLKAMEEMLKDRSGGMTEMDLTQLMKQAHEMLLTYYEKEIAECHIDIQFDLPEKPLMILGNPEQLSKTVMSLLANAVYAIVKKDDRGTTSPMSLALALKTEGKMAHLTIRDTGTGISENIINKIFDPFFTTKTTAEASGVGLYLSKEIAQNHGGDITVQSVKGEYTEFTITLPTL